MKSITKKIQDREKSINTNMIFEITEEQAKFLKKYISGFQFSYCDIDDFDHDPEIFFKDCIITDDMIWDMFDEIEPNLSINVKSLIENLFFGVLKYDYEINDIIVSYNDFIVEKNGKCFADIIIEFSIYWSQE